MSESTQKVELMRKWWLPRIQAFKVYVSQLPNSQEELAALSGPKGNEFFDEVTDLVMTKLGHPVKTDRAARIARNGK